MADTGVGQSCALAIERDILCGRYEPGSRLPPERRLAETMGVSRLTLRGALAELRASRLLSVRQGRGYEVRDFWRECGIEIVGSLLDLRGKRALTLIVDLLAVRRALARLLLERLAQDPPDDEARERVVAAVRAFGEATAAPLAELTERDLDIVAALAEATGSEVLRLCLNPVGRVLRSSLRLQQAMYRQPVENLMAYRAMIAWLEAGAREEAIDPMLVMLASIDESTAAAYAEGAKS